MSEQNDEPQEAEEVDGKADEKPEQKADDKAQDKAESKTAKKPERRSNGNASPPAKGNGRAMQAAGSEEEDRNLGAVMGIPVTVQVLLGSTIMPVAQLLKLGRGAIVTLDRRVGEPVDIVVNGTIVARGEIVGAEDDTHFGVSLTEIVGKPTLEEAE